MAVLTRMYTIITHPAEEGGYWGEVRELPGCVSQGETLDELQGNIMEAIEAVLQTEADAFRIDMQVESAVDEFRVSSAELPTVQSRSMGGSETWTAAS